MAETDLERVALAIFVSEIAPEDGTWETARPVDVSSYLDRAYIALRALSTPSDGMVEAAAAALHDSKPQIHVPRLGMHTFLWKDANPEWKANALKEMRAALTAAIQFALNQQETGNG